MITVEITDEEGEKTTYQADGAVLVYLKGSQVSGVLKGKNPLPDPMTLLALLKALRR